LASSSKFEAALKLKDESPHLAANPQYLADILWHLAHLAYRRAEVEMALGYLEGALPLISAQHAYFADIHITLGHCHAARGNQTKAREHYNAAAFAPLASSEQIEMAQRCLKEIGEAETA
jgi:predicted negative regulator of RcsB-dependent stress response